MKGSEFLLMVVVSCLLAWSILNIVRKVEKLIDCRAEPAVPRVVYWSGGGEGSGESREVEEDRGAGMERCCVFPGLSASYGCCARSGDGGDDGESMSEDDVSMSEDGDDGPFHVVTSTAQSAAPQEIKLILNIHCSSGRCDSVDIQDGESDDGSEGSESEGSEGGESEGSESDGSEGSEGSDGSDGSDDGEGSDDGDGSESDDGEGSDGEESDDGEESNGEEEEEEDGCAMGDNECRISIAAKGFSLDFTNNGGMSCSMDKDMLARIGSMPGDPAELNKALTGLLAFAMPSAPAPLPTDATSVPDPSVFVPSADLSVFAPSSAEEEEEAGVGEAVVEVPLAELRKQVVDAGLVADASKLRRKQLEKLLSSTRL